jgi:hypothetical protein
MESSERGQKKFLCGAGDFSTMTDGEGQNQNIAVIQQQFNY